MGKLLIYQAFTNPCLECHTCFEITGFLICCCLPLLSKAGLSPWPQYHPHAHAHLASANVFSLSILRIWGPLCLVWSTWAWVSCNLAKTQLIYWGSTLPRNSWYKTAYKGNYFNTNQRLGITKPYSRTYTWGLKHLPGREGWPGLLQGALQHSVLPCWDRHMTPGYPTVGECVKSPCHP